MITTALIAVAAATTVTVPAKPFAMVITGVSPYRQDQYENTNGKTVWEGCGPVAALMLMSYYDKRFGYKELIPSKYESSTSTPNDLIQTLRSKMKTIVVGKDDWGLTDPLFFKSGLKSYIKDRGYKADIDSKGSSDIGVSIDEVFDKSVELIQENKPHVLLLDWSGSQAFPSHYVVVVGYDKGGGHKWLIVCNGFGDDFQAVDFEDKSIKPVRVIWMSISTSPDGSQDGHQIGPASGGYSIARSVGPSGSTSGIKPTIIEPTPSTKTLTWGVSSETTMTAKTCYIAKWN